MRKIILFCAILFIMQMNAQSGVLWSNNYTVEMQYAYSDRPVIAYEADDAILKVTGRKSTENGERLSIVKYGLDGNVVSETIIGDALVSNNNIIDYKIDNEQNIYILSQENINSDLHRTVIQKYSPDGTFQWAEQLQDPVYSYTPLSITLNNSGSGIFIVTQKEIWEFDFSYNISLKLYIYNDNGTMLSEKTFDPDTELNWVSSQSLSTDNGIILFGNDLMTNQNFKVLNITQENTIQSNNIITTPAQFTNVQLTSENNILLLSKNRVSKITPEGLLLWLGPVISNTYYEISSAIQDDNGNIYVTGRQFDDQSATNNDILTTKYSSSGEVVWQNIYMYGQQNADIGETIALKNGHVYVGGQSQRLGIGTDYDYVLLKINAESGLQEGVYRYNGNENGNEQISSLYVFDNGDVALTGLSYTGAAYDQTTQLLSAELLGLSEISSNKNITVYPNPVSKGSLINIEADGLTHYKIVSSLSQIALEGNFDATAPYTITTNGLSPGLYFLILESEKGSYTKKLVIQ